MSLFAVEEPLLTKPHHESGGYNVAQSGPRDAYEITELIMSRSRVIKTRRSAFHCDDLLNGLQRLQHTRR